MTEKPFLIRVSDVPPLPDGKGPDDETWRRMGRELVVLRDLIGDILCDREYNRIMTKSIWEKLNRAIYAIDIVRGQAEDRMLDRTLLQDLSIFYPHDHNEKRAFIKDLRSRLHDGYHIQTEETEKPSHEKI